MKITLSQLKRIIKEEIQPPMGLTVGDLIAELQHLDANLPVRFGVDEPFELVQNVSVHNVILNPRNNDGSARIVSDPLRKPKQGNPTPSVIISSNRTAA